MDGDFSVFFSVRLLSGFPGLRVKLLLLLPPRADMTSPPSHSDACRNTAVAAAQRRGDDVETTKKWSAGQNKQHLVTKNTAKLDHETEELHHQRVPLEVGKVIQKGRQDQGLTQKDLATKISEKPQVIADYECGKAIPNNQVMGKIERAIGLKLRGKDIGQPLDAKPDRK